MATFSSHAQILNVPMAKAYCVFAFLIHLFIYLFLALLDYVSSQSVDLLGRRQYMHVQILSIVKSHA